MEIPSDAIEGPISQNPLAGSSRMQENIFVNSSQPIDIGSPQRKTDSPTSRSLSASGTDTPTKTSTVVRYF